MTVKPLIPEPGGLSFDAYKKLAEHIERTGQVVVLVSHQPLVMYAVPK